MSTGRAVLATASASARFRRRPHGPNHLDARAELRIPLSMIYRADGFGGRASRVADWQRIID